MERQNRTRVRHLCDSARHDGTRAARCALMLRLIVNDGYGAPCVSRSPYSVAVARTV